MINKEELIKQLTEKRKKIGLTQQQLAEAIRNNYNNNFTVTTLSKTELGKTNPLYSTLYQIDQTLEQFDNKIKSQSKNQKNKNKLATAHEGRWAYVEKIRVSGDLTESEST